jgi:hypothetical protein
LRREREEGVVLGPPLRRVPDHVEPRLRDAVAHDLALLTGPLCHPRLVPGKRRARGDVAEKLLDPRLHVLGLHVPRDDEGRVGGAVVRPEPLLHVVELRAVEVLHRTDHGPGVRVVLRVEGWRHEIPDAAVRLVLPLPLLVLDDAALLVEPPLRDGAEEVAHPVRLHPEDGVEGRDRHGLEVVGPVLAGGPVQVGRADPLQHLEVVVVEVLGAIEHEVFEEVGEAGLPEPLVLGPDVVPDVHGDDRRLVVLVHHQREAVGQHVAGEGNLRDLLCQRPGGDEAAEEGSADVHSHSRLRGGLNRRES